MQLTQLLIIFLIAVVISIILTAVIIPVMKKKQFQQFEREEGPESHFKKQGTPSMGGIAIISAMIIATVIGGHFSTTSIVMIVATVLFGVIGFIDDYSKAIKKQNEGLNAGQKVVFQVIVAVAFALYMANFTELGTQVWIPFADTYVDFGLWYIPFIVFVLLAMTNSVNLTDGLDGLASGVTTLVAMFFALAGVHFAADSVVVMCMALAGGCVGFLFFNRHPAKIFMGDTGSMALGAALSAAAIAMKAELLLPIAGLIYVIEALSVIIQVTSFKLTGKRVFRMAPIHHHFELGGMKEQAVVAMFWGGAIVCCVLALVVMDI